MNIEKTRHANSISAIAKWISGVAVAFLLTVLAFYFANFNNGLSSDQATWGTFGDFLGGTLNPLFSLLALLALLVTIVQQREALNISSTELKLTREELEKSSAALNDQVQHMRMEIELNDINRLIDKISSRINTNFNENRLGKIRGIGTESLSVHQIVKQQMGGDDSSIAALRDRLKDGTSDAAITMTWIHGDLKRLKVYIETYTSILAEKEIGKNRNKAAMLQEYFQHEFSDLVCLLHTLGIIDAGDLYRFYVPEHFGGTLKI